VIGCDIDCIDCIPCVDNGTAAVEENTVGEVCCVDGTETVDDIGDTMTTKNKTCG